MAKIEHKTMFKQIYLHLKIVLGPLVKLIEQIKLESNKFLKTTSTLKKLIKHLDRKVQTNMRFMGICVQGNTCKYRTQEGQACYGSGQKGNDLDLINVFLMSVGLFKNSYSKSRSVSLLLHSNVSIRNLEYDSLAFSFIK